MSQPTVGLLNHACQDLKHQIMSETAQPKWVAFTGAGSAKVDAPGSGAPGRALANYLALPVSQYSLLDPKFVERCAFGLRATILQTCSLGVSL